jgi:hypothetical protein
MIGSLQLADEGVFGTDSAPAPWPAGAESVPNDGLFFRSLESFLRPGVKNRAPPRLDTLNPITDLPLPLPPPAGCARQRGARRQRRSGAGGAGVRRTATAAVQWSWRRRSPARGVVRRGEVAGAEREGRRRVLK